MDDGQMLVEMRFPSLETCAWAANSLNYAGVAIHARPSDREISVCIPCRWAPLLSNLLKSAVGEPSFNRIQFRTYEYVEEQ